MIGVRRTGLGVLGALSLAACAASGDNRADTPQNFAGIAPDETISLGGTEPFWSIAIEGTKLTYTSPEKPGGEVAEVRRFSGNNGLGFSGELAGKNLQIAVTPGECSDDMTDFKYPFTATVNLGDATLLGCGYTDSNPITGEESE